ncbi:shikimate kinase [Geomicrobium halophilum]|nr:shikimate kinase [Geomicrobium halophilum]
MGSGKTTIGEAVAKKLYRDFIDIDQTIESEYGLSVTEIFNQYGEEEFREREKALIKKYSLHRLKVISVGGGAFLQEEIRNTCLENCIVFFLDLSWDSWKDRLDILVESRPVLQGRSIDDIRELFYNRKGIYALHNSKLNTDDLNVEEVSQYVIDSLKTSWELYN